MPRHPIHTLLNEAAYAGREVTDAELKELKLRPADRELVREAAAEAARVHERGDHGRAHALAEEKAHNIVGELPEKQRRADYLREPDHAAAVTDPRELAKLVPRYY